MKDTAKKKSDARTDIYSLGLTLYELIAGRAAFREDSRPELTNSILEREPDSLTKLDRQVSRDLRIIVERSIAKSADDRYQSANELKDDLQRFLDGRTIKAKPASSMSRVTRFARRNPTIATLTLTTMLLLSVIAAGTRGGIGTPKLMEGGTEGPGENGDMPDRPGLVPVSPAHKLRHTSIKRVHDERGPVAAKKHGGHRSFNQLDRYATQTRKESEEMADELFP